MIMYVIDAMRKYGLKQQTVLGILRKYVPAFWDHNHHLWFTEQDFDNAMKIYNEEKTKQELKRNPPAQMLLPMDDGD